MESAPPIPPPTVDDLNHLRWLSIAHYIYAGFIALSSLFALIFIALGLFAGSLPQGRNDPSPEVMRWIFIGVGGAVLVLGLGIATLFFFVGRNIGQRRHHTYCVVMSGIACLSVPIGTLLGVFTLIVLFRPSVKPLFEPRAGVIPQSDAI